MMRAERDLARTRLAAREGGEAATESLAAAISGLRELSTLTTSLMACSTTRSTSSASATPPRPLSTRLAT